jgi:flavin reductase (DIM6/NTAB) family NADH-FMN oxidoreductase RutF
MESDTESRKGTSGGHSAGSGGDDESGRTMVDLAVDIPIWDRFFLPAPLVVVGTKEGEGFDLAPKHMALPIGWQNYFGFVCTPRHGTYHNAQREGAFTVSLPRPDQIVMTSLSAQPRGESGATQGLELLPTEPAEVVDGVLLRGAAVHLECELDRVVDGFGVNSLIVGRVVAARVRADTLRTSDSADAELLEQSPLLVYVSPGRFAEVSTSRAFPFPADFRR